MANAVLAAKAKLQPHKQNVSVITCDMEGRIETYNEGAHRIFGYAPDEVIGKRRVSLFSPGEIVLGHVPRWLKEASTKGSFETDTVFVRKDGTQIAAHVRITPTFHGGKSGGTQVGFCGTTTVLEEVDPAAIMPKTSFATRIFKGVVVGRLPFLTATMVPILLAAAWIATQSASGLAIDWISFGLVMAGGLALHLAANTFNDYWDWKTGTDQANNDYFLPFSGGSRSIELGLITPRGMFMVGTVSILVAAGLGAALFFMGKPLVLAFGAAGAIMGFFYTAPPLRLAARRGLGEFTTFLNFGPLLTAGAIYGISGHVSVASFLVGIPIGLLTLAILWVNEFPDVAGDLHTGKNHLVATLGTRRARWGYLAIVVGAFSALAGLVVAGTFTKGALIGLLAAILGAFAIMKVIQNYGSRSLAKACAMTIQLHLVAGLLMAAGLAWVKI